MQFKDNKVWSFFVEKNIVQHSIDLYWMAQGVNGKSYRRKVKEVEDEELDEGMSMHPDGPSLRLDYDEAQTLMQSLWEAGVRPNGVGSGKDEVDAMKEHLNTMKMVLGHFMQMQNHGVESDLYDQIQALKETVAKITDDHPF